MKGYVIALIMVLILTGCGGTIPTNNKVLLPPIPASLATQFPSELPTLKGQEVKK